MDLPTTYALKFSAPTAKPKTERDELIRNFLGRGIMLHDRTKQLKDATAKDIAMLLRHVPTQDLFPFHKMCMGARSYARFFFWSLKKKV